MPYWSALSPAAQDFLRNLHNCVEKKLCVFCYPKKVVGKDARPDEPLPACAAHKNKIKPILLHFREIILHNQREQAQRSLVAWRECPFDDIRRLIHTFATE